jgi:hypothetical protein
MIIVDGQKLLKYAYKCNIRTKNTMKIKSRLKFSPCHVLKINHFTNCVKKNKGPKKHTRKFANSPFCGFRCGVHPLLLLEHSPT